MIKTLKRFKIAILFIIVYIGLYIWAPAIGIEATRVSWSYFKEMVYILPPVFIAMGLMQVWIPKDKIKKWLGNKSGIKGAVISVVLGTLPTGPLYIAFPMAATLRNKGASVNNIVLFLGSWAALKIPQLMVETEFLGTKFAGLRFVLTLSALVVIGTLMNWILETSADNKLIDNENG